MRPLGPEIPFGDHKLLQLQKNNENKV